MKLYLFAVVCLLLFATPAWAQAVDSTIEPPITYDVVVNGKKITVQEGVDTAIAGTFTSPTLRITPQDWRTFRHDNLTFSYYRSFSFEADVADPNGKVWTFDGNDVVLMYQEIAGSVSTLDFANYMLQMFGEGNGKVIAPVKKWQLDSVELTGSVIGVEIAEQKLGMEIFQIPGDGKTTRLLIVQDSLGETGKHSSEYQRTVEQLKSSLRLGGADDQF